MSTDNVFNCTPVALVHRIPWHDNELTFTSYELLLVLRIAGGGRVPLEHLPIASAFVTRFEDNGLDFKEVAKVISETVTLAPPHLHFLDEEGLYVKPDMLTLAEAIYVEHNDWWREQDADVEPTSMTSGTEEEDSDLT